MTKIRGRSCFLLILLLISTSLFSETASNHRARQTRPIRLGTSGGNTQDFSKRFCCSGTLGAEVKDASGKMYILSNNHVLAKSNKGIIGQDVTQPGLIDTNCFEHAEDIVAHLSVFAKINFNLPNNVDAALAEVVPGKVNTRGKILDIGRPGQPREAAIGMLVKKSGRTSGKTFGRIVAIKTTVVVALPRHCGDEKGTRARFVDQIMINSTTSRHFIDSGDSGSLLVQRKRLCPRAIGLLFAGDDDGNATANRIQNVLSAFKVKVVGCGGGATAALATELNSTHPSVIHAEAIRSRFEDQLFRIPGVVGVGIGSSKENSTELAIVVFVQKDSAAAASASAVPSHLDQLPVKIIPTSGFRAF